MIDLENTVKEVVGLQGEYTSIDNLIKTYPYVTINGVTVLNVRGKMTPALTFDQDPAKYFFASSGDLGKLFSKLLNQAQEQGEDLNNTLKYRRLKLKLHKIKTKTGNTYLKVTYLGTIHINPDTGEIERETNVYVHSDEGLV